MNLLAVGFLRGFESAIILKRRRANSLEREKTKQREQEDSPLFLIAQVEHDGSMIQRITREGAYLRTRQIVEIRCSGQHVVARGAGFQHFTMCTRLR
jgi:hypothetical protein